MSRYCLDINRPVADVEKSHQRLAALEGFDYVDRVPVIFGVEARCLLGWRNVSFTEYFASARDQFFHQLENLRWRIERIPDDYQRSLVLRVQPDFQFISNASGCGCEVRWFEDGPPSPVPCLESPADLDTHDLAHPSNNLWTLREKWYHEFQVLAREVDVRMGGEAGEIEVSLGIDPHSPFCTAVDMAGDAFYLWLYEAPEACERFLHRVTERLEETESRFRSVSGRRSSGITLSEDAAQNISLDQYRRFGAPFARRLFRAFGHSGAEGRMLHLCGRSTHLLPALRDDLGITWLHGFGYDNDPREVAEALGGRAILQGNLDPQMLEAGSVSDIESATAGLIEALGGTGGLVVGDGYNIGPETPVENLEAVIRTADELGAPAVTRR